MTEAETKEEKAKKLREWHRACDMSRRDEETPRYDSGDDDKWDTRSMREEFDR